MKNYNTTTEIKSKNAHPISQNDPNESDFGQVSTLISSDIITATTNIGAEGNIVVSEVLINTDTSILWFATPGLTFSGSINTINISDGYLSISTNTINQHYPRHSLRG